MTKLSLLALAALALAACSQANNDMSSPYPSGGGSEGSTGDSFCAQAPSDMSKMEQWNQMCMPGRD